MLFKPTEHDDVNTLWCMKQTIARLFWIGITANKSCKNITIIFHYQSWRIFNPLFLWLEIKFYEISYLRMIYLFTFNFNFHFCSINHLKAFTKFDESSCVITKTKAIKFYNFHLSLAVQFTEKRNKFKNWIFKITPNWITHKRHKITRRVVKYGTFSD